MQSLSSDIRGFRIAGRGLVSIGKNDSIEEQYSVGERGGLYT
jgi:hypothetical protein